MRKVNLQLNAQRLNRYQYMQPQTIYYLQQRLLIYLLRGASCFGRLIFFYNQNLSRTLVKLTQALPMYRRVVNLLLEALTLCDVTTKIKLTINTL